LRDMIGRPNAKGRAEVRNTLKHKRLRLRVARAEQQQTSARWRGGNCKRRTVAPHIKLYEAETDRGECPFFRLVSLAHDGWLTAFWSEKSCGNKLFVPTASSHNGLCGDHGGFGPGLSRLSSFLCPGLTML
jgi:hypothetical protein